MKKYLVLFLALGYLASCQNNTPSEKQTKTKPPIDSSKTEVVKTKDVPPAQTTEEKGTIEYVEGRSLIPGTYRVGDEPGVEHQLSDKKWLDLFSENGVFKLAKAKCSVTEGYDECAGVKTEIIETPNKSLLLLKIPGLKTGVVKSIPVEKKRIWPNEVYEFSFNGKQYVLKGFGNSTGNEMREDSGKVEAFHKVSDYELCFINANGEKHTIVSEKSFNDTFISVDFIGDLDGDGLPDFIISVPRDYEEERSLVILSSQMSNDKVIIYEASRQFDC